LGFYPFPHPPRHEQAPCWEATGAVKEKKAKAPKEARGGAEPEERPAKKAKGGAPHALWRITGLVVVEWDRLRICRVFPFRPKQFDLFPEFYGPCCWQWSDFILSLSRCICSSDETCQVIRIECLWRVYKYGIQGFHPISDLLFPHNFSSFRRHRQFSTLKKPEIPQ